jgi:signal transduction histidine kinase
MVGIIGVIDYLLGFQLSMAGFYVIPVGLVSWRVGKNAGILFSILSAMGLYVVYSLTRPLGVSAIFPVWKAGEGLVFFLIISWLVAGRRQEQEKREKLMAQLQESAILEERNRMAGEIHDTLAQGFTGIVVQLEAAEDILAEDAEVAKGHLDRARKLARQSLADARRSVLALRAPELKAGGLSSAVNQFIEQVAGGTSTRVESAIQGAPYALPTEVEYGLLRICQEAVVNALRHAKAGKIHIELIYEPVGLRLTVEDDGQGFDPRLSEVGGGFGLVGMQERARRIGVNLEVRSQPGAGTCIGAEAPKPPPRMEGHKP